MKETPDQTSDKNTFEVFDTKPSTCANNDPANPPKKKPNGDITIVSFPTSTFIYKFIQKKKIYYVL